MARRPLSERDRQLRAAQADLNEQRRLLREQRQRVAAAKRVVDALNRCSSCGVQVPPAMGAQVLCWPCTRLQIDERRAGARAALPAKGDADHIKASANCRR